MSKVCSVEGCGEKVHGRGLCKKHYNAQYQATRYQDPEYRERARLYAATRRQDPAYQEYMRQYNAARSQDPEYLEQKRQWHRQTPEGITARLNRDSQKRGTYTSGLVTIDRVRELMEVTECPYCGMPVTEDNRHFDHVIPFVLGGTHTDDNIQVLCAQCNRWKGSTTPDAFFAEVRAMVERKRK